MFGQHYQLLDIILPFMLATASVLVLPLQPLKEVSRTPSGQMEERQIPGLSQDSYSPSGILHSCPEFSSSLSC